MTTGRVIHRFNEIGLACQDPRWAGGRPRLLTVDGEDFVIQTPTTRPVKPGKPFTWWSIGGRSKRADHLRRDIARPVRIGREAMWALRARRGITSQRTNTWKEPTDADFDAKREQREYAINERPDRTFAFDAFGPLGSRPSAGSCWTERRHPDRLSATFTAPTTPIHFHGGSWTPMASGSGRSRRSWGVS